MLNLMRLLIFLVVATVIVGLLILFGLFFLPFLLLGVILFPFFARPRIIFRTGTVPPPQPDDKFEPEDEDIPANEAVIDVEAVEIPAEKRRISGSDD
ncbi:MAG: hypothetical protein COT06_09370 [Syntrophobacteraceae bacterium CG07_land_8_20_14_0_80_61_8]|nr:MAG: hypothetical protein COT06_09370 [Syntrophobacteraceae bacterium CG07_land_8_20_14_0_80_61_8]